MNRRQFLKTGAAAAAGALVAPGVLGAPGARDPGSLPNVLVIYTDQQSCWTLSSYGADLIETPHIDSLARDGALFGNFFTNSAVCTPSRGCFQTGRYPHAHGAYKNNIPLGRDEVTFAQVLRERGYDTGYAGKWHLDGTRKPGWVKETRSMGYDDCRFMFNRGHYKKVEEQEAGDPQFSPYKVIGDAETYTTDWLARKTIEFIERPRENPFCYMVSIPDPHTPFTVRPPYDTMFQPAKMTIPATLGQKDLPLWVKKARESGKQKPPSKKKLRSMKARYLGEVKLIDDSVGRILDCLEKKGILDDTIVIFTTDHGEYMGEHGLMAKNNLYEPAYRLPLLVRWPGKIKARTRVDRVVSTVDFQATLLGLIGVDPCGRHQGNDASPFLCGKETAWDDVAQIHHSSLERAGIFTPEFELAYVKESEAILFDRQKDPDQVQNLFAKKKYKKIVDDLFERIVAHHEETESPAAAWLKEMAS